jgi:DNA-damage-inducible protein D
MSAEKEIVEVPADFRASLDGRRRVTRANVEYWRARDIQEVLGYDSWDRFRDVIERARTACESAGLNPDNHIRRTAKMVPVGSGAQREVEDYFLNRFGCYVAAMNGESSKPQIGYAQAYFAIQARRQELADEREEQDEDGKRIEIRDRVRGENKALHSAAKKAGVKRYGIFNDGGYRGLYGGLSLAEVKALKGLGSKDELLDRSGRVELAAHEFRITQTEERLATTHVRGEEVATRVHHEVGKVVREAMRRGGGTMPEHLRAEPSIKKIEATRRKALAAPKKEPE